MSVARDRRGGRGGLSRLAIVYVIYRPILMGDFLGEYVFPYALIHSHVGCSLYLKG